jgi:SOS-response transcriptional repressor LexA
MRNLRHLRRNPLNTANLRRKCLRDAFRARSANSDTPHNRAANPKLARDPAIQPLVKRGAPEDVQSRVTLLGHNVSSVAPREYKDSFIAVKNKIRNLLTAEYANRLKDLRRRLGWTQSELAKICTVHQVQISRWEAGLDVPSSQALLAIGRAAGDPEKAWWWGQAGLSQNELANQGPNEPDIRRIPLLKDAAAAGTARAVNEKEIDRYISLPEDWIGRRSSITAIKVVGDSMAPILDEGYIVLVDTSDRDPKKLVNQMVAARDDEGVTIKWLRKQKDLFLLVPQHTSVRHQVRVITPGSDSVSIVGKVVKWIGEPPPPRK